ncbi:MAG: hypothetical protein WAV55_03190 [Clostridiaceae bacterium]
MRNPYEDIINLPHHTSTSRPRMSAHDRAAQFSPFAALTGYSSAITETARLTNRRIELDESIKADLNDKLAILQDQLEEQPEVSITYFKSDLKKSGGAYITASGWVKKIDQYKRTVIMADATIIPMDDIFEMEGELFSRFDNLEI